LKLSGNKKGKKENQKMEESTVEDLVSALSLRKDGLMENADVIETYPLMPPFSFAVILEEKDTKKPVYIVDEIPLTKTEREKYFEIKRILETDLEAPREKETPLNSFRRQFPFIRKKHPKTMRNLETVEEKLITYYLERDIAGLGIIDPLFYDPYAEDISCSGVAKPIYLWHRKYENIRTNVIFNDEDELDNFIVRLAHKAGKHVFIHSCGDVDELFDDLIGIGVNYFNPFQPEVMDVHELLKILFEMNVSASSLFPGYIGVVKALEEKELLLDIEQQKSL